MIIDHISSFFFSEVVLGENIVGEDPDCDNRPSVIRRKIDKRDIIVHEGYKRKGSYATEHYRNDIGKFIF